MRSSVVKVLALLTSFACVALAAAGNGELDLSSNGSYQKPFSTIERIDTQSSDSVATVNWKKRKVVEVLAGNSDKKKKRKVEGLGEENKEKVQKGTFINNYNNNNLHIVRSFDLKESINELRSALEGSFDDNLSNDVIEMLRGLCDKVNWDDYYDKWEEYVDSLLENRSFETTTAATNIAEMILDLLPNEIPEKRKEYFSVLNELFKTALFTEKDRQLLLSLQEYAETKPDNSRPLSSAAYQVQWRIKYRSALAEAYPLGAH